MSFIPVPSATDVGLHFLLSNQQVVLTFGVYRPDGVTLNLDALCAKFHAWFDGQLKQHLSSALTLRYITARPLHAQGLPVVEYILPTPLSGSLANTVVANNVALCVGFKTSLAGRSYRGRNYVPGLIEGDTPDGVSVATTRLLGIVQAYSNLKPYLDALGVVHGIVSRYLNKSARTTGVITPVTGYYGDAFLDSMRRRLAGRGV